VEILRPLFPQLEILELIGQGGMGAVYKARQPGLNRPVALKILTAAVSADAGFADRFTREAQLLARLQHPRIVAIHDVGVAGSLHYLLMEYVDGPNLRQMQRTGRLAPEQALRIVPEICEALQFAHDRSVVHRDIKPENVLLDKAWTSSARPTTWRPNRLSGHWMSIIAPTSTRWASSFTSC
jgi:serine/threonine protein kinase